MARSSSRACLPACLPAAVLPACLLLYCLPAHCTAGAPGQQHWCQVIWSKGLPQRSGVCAAHWCCPLLCCSEDRGPTRNLLTSQFLTPAELRQMLQHCYRRADRQGLMLAAMLALGVYNGFR
jgi:integrase